MDNPYSPAPLPHNPVAPDLLNGLQQRPTNQNNTNSPTFPNAIGLNESAFRPASIINLSNSSDVVIGPMTQYQGAVTIYQYMDATISPTRRPGSQGIKAPNEQWFGTFQRNKIAWLTISFIVLIAIGAAIGVYIESSKKGNTGEPPVRDILFGNEYEDDTIPNLGHGHLVIDRKQWGAIEYTNKNTTITPLKPPIPNVIITHVGVQFKPCDNVYECSVQMRSIQDAAVAGKKLPDIQSNFYVSGDGYVYVGRGWKIANIYSNKSLAVTFIGDYLRYTPTERQFDAVKHLLAHGVARQYLSPDYRLIAHNQTKKTQSPGVNVYKEIVKWPHWYACGIDTSSNCDI